MSNETTELLRRLWTMVEDWEVKGEVLRDRVQEIEPGLPAQIDRAIGRDTPEATP